MTTFDKDSKDSKDYTETQVSSAILNPQRTKKRAIRILGSRQLSSSEIEKRLLSKGESPDATKETVEWLENIGAVNDVEYAASIVSHYSSKGYGLAKVKDELHRRGIPRDLWDDAISTLERTDITEAATQFLKKKLKDSNDESDRRRAIETLCRRGFSYEEARSAMSQYLETIENTKEYEEME
jgi:regulatory protein